MVKKEMLMSKQSVLSTEQIMAALDQAGLSQTHPRRAIAEQVAAWAEEGRDFTIEDLWHAVRMREPGLGRATAFRTVEVLVTLGVLDRVSFVEGPEHYHPVQPGSHHHHLTCDRCHRVVEVETCLSPDLLEAVAQHSGFVLSGHRLELFGRCPRCQKE
jgi:Fur family ferric uptake transcriptional regulator